MSAQKTGYYDRTGKAIRDGDKVKAIIEGQIIRGYVEPRINDWDLFSRDLGLSFGLKDLDDIEILED